jgi:hypothetical protein
VSQAAKLSYLEMIETNESENTECLVTINRVKGDLSFLEKPVLVTSSVEQGKSYLKQSVAIGFVLGILLSFVILMLWKYIFDARRYYH